MTEHLGAPILGAVSPEEVANDTMLAGLRQIPGGVWRTYLAPGVKTAFISINKNACTSLKWMMADLAGEDLDTFRVRWQPHVDDSEAVHDRSLWRVSPWLNKLSPQQRMQIHPDRGWFIFAVVRDPRLRVFSAWQNKLLIEGPHSQRWRKEAWYPRHPVSRKSIIEDFAAFVDALEQPDMWLRREDPHFRDQVELLAEHAVPYTRIYEIGELGHLRSDLAEHLERQGHPIELFLPRANPTPLHANGALFTGGVREQIERLYAADFERFGHLWDFRKTAEAPPWTDRELAACEAESRLGRRIAQLHAMARTERNRRIAAEEQVAALDAASGATPSAL